MDPVTIALGCATLWTVYMTHKAKDSANAAAARTETTIDINRAIAELERNLEAKIQQNPDK